MLRFAFICKWVLRESTLGRVYRSWQVFQQMWRVLKPRYEAFLVGKGRRSEMEKKAEGEKKGKALLLSLLLSIAFSNLSSTKPWERVHLFMIGLFIEDLQGNFKKAHLTRQRFVDIHFTINRQSKPNSLKKWTYKNWWQRRWQLSWCTILNKN